MVDITAHYQTARHSCLYSANASILAAHPDLCDLLCHTIALILYSEHPKLSLHQFFAFNPLDAEDSHFWMELMDPSLLM